MEQPRVLDLVGGVGDRAPDAAIWRRWGTSGSTATALGDHVPVVVMLAIQREAARRVLAHASAKARRGASEEVLGKAQELEAAVMHAYTLENTPRAFIGSGTDEDEMVFDDYIELVASTEAALTTYLREHPELEQRTRHPGACRTARPVGNDEAIRWLVVAVLPASAEGRSG